MIINLFYIKTNQVKINLFEELINQDFKKMYTKLIYNNYFN